MLHRIWAIALNTHREAVRQKILYGLVIFTAVLILFSLFLGQLSLGADTKIIKDMGLAAIMGLGALMSIFMGVGLVFKEIDRRTIYTILSKPVSRAEFILGKYFGLCLTIGIEVLAMTLLLFLVLFLYIEPLDFSLCKAVILIYVELCVLIAASLLFSSYSSAFMSSLFCLSFLFVGHLTDDLVMLIGPKISGIVFEAQGFMRLSGYVLYTFVNLLELMSLDHFVINAKIVHGVPVSWIWVMNSVFYGFCWVLIILSAAIFLFKRKDLQ